MTTTTANSLSYLKKLSFFALTLVVIKLLILPFVHEIDADAITRTYFSLDFANHPHLIKSGNWPPFFFYMMGGALKIYNNQFFTPVFVNIVLSVALLFPLFFILKRLFDDKISFLLCIFFSLSPIVFRMSLLGMSEIPYLFFTILSVHILVKGVVDKKPFLIVIAGLIMSLASGVRYESWMLSAFIVVILFYQLTWKEALLFAIPAFLFPTYWILSNHFQTNDALNSFNWAIVAPKEDVMNSFEDFLRRIWWFPVSLLFAFGPIAFFFFIKEVKNTFKDFRKEKIKSILIVATLLILIIWITNCIRGSLLMQHRFSITLFLLSFSFIGYYLKQVKNPVKTTLILSLSAFLLAFVYSSKGARPIPRLLTNDAEIVATTIKKNLQPNAGFMCDFWNWETTYYLPFSTGLHVENIKILEENESKEVISSKLILLVKTSPAGIVLVKKNNNLSQLLNTQPIVSNSDTVQLQLNVIFENEEIICYNYKVL